MRKLLFLTFLFCQIVALAEDNNWRWREDFSVTSHTSSGKELQSFETALAVNYFLTKSLSLGVQCEEAVSLFEIDNAKDHYLNTTVGGKVSYSFLSIENTKISLKGMVGTSLSNKNWKYTYYDGGVFIEGGKESTKPFVGFGYRYYDSRNDLFSNYSTFYMSLGFSFEFL